MARLCMCQMHINCWTTTSYGRTGERNRKTETLSDILFFWFYWNLIFVRKFIKKSQCKKQKTVIDRSRKCLTDLLWFRWRCDGNKRKKKMKHVNWVYCIHQFLDNHSNNNNRLGSNNQKTIFNRRAIITQAFHHHIMIMNWANVFTSVAVNQVILDRISNCFQITIHMISLNSTTIEFVMFDLKTKKEKSIQFFHFYPSNRCRVSPPKNSVRSRWNHLFTWTPWQW